MPVDRAQLDQRIVLLKRALAGHMGGLELADISTDGAVRVRFTGACIACPLKPFTLTTAVRPVLLQVPGVTDVQARGCNLSTEATQRLAGVAP